MRQKVISKASYLWHSIQLVIELRLIRTEFKALKFVLGVMDLANSILIVVQVCDGFPDASMVVLCVKINGRTDTR